MYRRERLVLKHCYPTRDEAHSEVLNYIEMFYNPVRRHGSAGDLAPVGFERRYAQSGSWVSTEVSPVHLETSAFQ